jgi:hypothetical protein
MISNVMRREPLQLRQKLDFLEGVKPIESRIASSNISNEEFLHAFITSRSVFPFSRKIYSGGRLFALPACSSKIVGVTTYIDN